MELVNEDANYLEEKEMLNIELHNKNLRVKELETMVVQQKQRVFQLEIEKELMKKHNEYSSLSDKKAKYVELLKDKYNIDSDQFSFDPITGEIKDE